MRTDQRVEFSPISERVPMSFPNGARVAVWIAPNIEHWIPDTPGATINPSGAGQMPDIMNTGWRNYGLRVGYWRLTEIFDRVGVRASLVLNADVCDFEPQVVRSAVERNWDFLGHGRSNSQRLSGLDEVEERRVIQHTYDRLRQATGRSPQGWLGPGLAETHVTPDLLCEVGFRFVCDWCDDDQPHTMRTRTGQSMLTVPYSVETNDFQAFLQLHMTAPEFGRMLCDQFDCLYAEGEYNGRVMCIALHPFLTGQPHRAVHLERALRYMKRHDGVWWATGTEIAQWYEGQVGAQ